MMVSRLKIGAAAAALAYLAASPGAALAGKCSSGETKAAGKKASCKAGVLSKAAAKNLAPDAGKLAACDTKFSAGFTKAQSAGGCPSSETAGQMETTVDNFVNDLNSEIAVGPLPSKCQAAKLKAAGKKAGCKLGVQAKGLAKDIAPDPGKLQACSDKFAAAFAKAETGTTCGAAANATTIENKVDAFMNDVVNTLNPPASCCGFPGAGPTRLSFTTGIGSGNCGTIQNSSGATIKNLTCGGLYTGAGSNTVPLPYNVPDMGRTLTGISSCSGNSLSFTNLTSGQTGSNRNCSSVGCLFGPPLPIPNSVSTPTSVCVVNVVATNASGSADCTTGASNLSLPLTSNLFLDGDLFPNAPGIQVCPTCNATCTGGTNAGGPCNTNTDCPGGGTCGGANVCHGGPNNGNACTPAASPINAGFPTSHDCPPPPGNAIGGLPIAFNLTTGTQTRTAVNQPSQNNVFCGFCRDINAAGTGCFEGDPNGACPPSSAPRSCTSDANCTNAAFPDCQQRDAGAFGPAGGAAHTINVTGSPAGDMTDGNAHASTLVNIFCIQPTFNATVDAAGDLPGPGAVSLPGQAQLLP